MLVHRGAGRHFDCADGVSQCSSDIWRNKLIDEFDTTNRERFRPAHHHTPLYGWMNDPNGMFYKDREDTYVSVVPSKELLALRGEKVK